MRRAVAALITVVIGALMLWTGVRREDRSQRASSETATTGSPGARDDRSQPTSKTPGFAAATDRIEALLECARRGDVQSYLSSFSRAMRARLEPRVEERGLQAFGAELRRFGQLQKSHAIFAPEPAGADFDSVRVVLETTFPDRNERQIYRLRLCDGEWLVTDVESVREQVPKNAVGSWATYREPEGVPVPIKDEGCTDEG